MANDPIMAMLALEVGVSIPLLFWLKDERRKYKARCENKQNGECVTCRCLCLRACSPADNETCEENAKIIKRRLGEPLKPVEGRAVSLGEPQDATGAGDEHGSEDFHAPISPAASVESTLAGGMGL